MKMIVLVLFFICLNISPSSSEPPKQPIDLAVVIRMHGHNVIDAGDVRGFALASDFLLELSKNLQLNNDPGADGKIVDATRVAIIKERFKVQTGLQLETQCHLDHSDPIGCIRSATYELDVHSTSTVKGNDDNDLNKYLRDNVFKSQLGDRPEMPNYKILIALSPGSISTFTTTNPYPSMHIVLVAEDYQDQNKKIRIVSDVKNKELNKEFTWAESASEVVKQLDLILTSCEKMNSTDGICYNRSDGCGHDRVFTNSNKDICPDGTGVRKCKMNACRATCDNAMTWTVCDCKTKTQTKSSTNTSWDRKFYEKCAGFTTGTRDCVCTTEPPTTITVKMAPWMIAIIALGTIALVLTIVGIVVCVCTAKRQKRKKGRPSQATASPRPTFLPPQRDGRTQMSMTQGASMGPSVTRR